MSTAWLPAGDVRLEGELTEPDTLRGVVVFAHGSGSSRRSPRNRQVAAALTGHGFGALLFDLLTPGEEVADARTAELRFNVPLLAGRLTRVVTWLRAEASTQAGGGTVPMGLFGASTGAAAALVTAAAIPGEVAAVVSRGGRPDLAGSALAEVAAPTRLIVGALDTEVRALNERALAAMGGRAEGHDLVVVPGVGHLFEEPGALREVARLSVEWFQAHLAD